MSTTQSINNNNNNQINLTRPNVSSIRSLREKIFHNMILFKLIIYTVTVLMINNVFFYSSYLYEWLNVNNYHNTIDYKLLIPRYIFYPLIITCNGTELDMYMTCVLLYNLGKRMEILHKFNMKRIILFSYMINVLINGVFINYIISRIVFKGNDQVASLFLYPTGCSFLLVSLLSQYKFVTKYTWEFKIFKNIKLQFTNNIFLKTIVFFYLINHYKEIIPLLIQYIISLYI